MAVTFSMLHFKYKLLGLLAHVKESHISYWCIKRKSSSFGAGSYRKRVQKIL